jgi:hypothetical protein
MTKAGNTGGNLFFQVLCDTGFGTCPKGAHYPKPHGKVVLKPLPRAIPTMPDPCQGVPANPWCPRKPHGHAGHHGPSVTVAAPVLPVVRTARRPQPAS